MPSVVLVANDLEVRALLHGMLEEQGVSVVAADDAGEAMARVGAMEDPPDLLLVDRRIARDAEVELIEWMRSRSRLRDVPVVLFTAHGRGSEGPPPPLDGLREAFDAALVLAIVQAVCRTR